MHWSWSKSHALHPHPISLIIMHSYSSSCRWWCREFIFFILCTIICTCHFISCIQACIHKSYLHQTPFVFQVTSYYIFNSFNLHMPLITTFSSLVVGLWGQFGRRNLLEKKFLYFVMMHVFWLHVLVIQASELHGCMFPGFPCHTQTETNGNAPWSTNHAYISGCFSDKSCQ